MVQNKELEKEKVTENGVVDESLGSQKFTNGIHEDETFEESEEEDDYMQYLTIVPTLDKSVENRNMNLIAQSLMNFYTAIESRKEYQRIKQELMQDYVPNNSRKNDDIQEKVEVKLEVKEAINSKPEDCEPVNEVTKAECKSDEKGGKQLQLLIHKAPFGKIILNNVHF